MLDTALLDVPGLIDSSPLLDGNNSINSGMIWAVYPEFFYRDTNKNDGYPLAQTAFDNSGLTINSNSAGGAYWARPTALNAITDQFTFFWYGSINTAGIATQQYLLSVTYQPDGTFPNAPFWSTSFYNDASSTLAALSYTVGTTENYAFSGTGFFVSNTQNLYAVSKSSTTITFSKNGVSHSTASASGNINWNSNTTTPIQFSCATPVGDTKASIAKNIILAGIANRVLSLSELLSIYNNPYQLITNKR